MSHVVVWNEPIACKMSCSCGWEQTTPSPIPPFIWHGYGPGIGKMDIGFHLQMPQPVRKSPFIALSDISDWHHFFIGRTHRGSNNLPGLPSGQPMPTATPDTAIPAILTNFLYTHINSSGNVQGSRPVASYPLYLQFVLSSQESTPNLVVSSFYSLLYCAHSLCSITYLGEQARVGWLGCPLPTPLFWSTLSKVVWWAWD